MDLMQKDLARSRAGRATGQRGVGVERGVPLGEGKRDEMKNRFDSLSVLTVYKTTPPPKWLWPRPTWTQDGDKSHPTPFIVGCMTVWPLQNPKINLKRKKNNKSG